MSTQIIRPTSDVYVTNVLPASNVYSYIDDDGTNADYIDFPLGGANEFYVNVADYTLAGNERVAQARIVIELQAGGPIDTFTMFYNNAQQESLLNHYIFVTPTKSRYNGRWIQERPGGGEWTQQAINGILARCYDANRNPAKPRISTMWVELDVRHKPTISAIAPGSGASLTTRTPVVTWTYTDPDALDVQSAFQVRIFTQAQVATGGFDPDLFPPVHDSGIIQGTQALYPMPSELGDGTYYTYVRVAKTHMGDDWFSTWSNGGTFIIDSTPLTPTAVTPANASTINTDIPVLGATVTAQPLGGKSRIRWQIASDAGFTINLRDVTEPVSAQRVSGASTMTLPVGSQLNQGVWYIHAAQVDESGIQGPWSANQSFTVAHVPTTSEYWPSSGAVVALDSQGRTILSWLFNDTSPVDYQSAYQIIVETNAGALILDTGKIAAASGQARVAIPVAFKEVALRWRVQVWDSDDVASAWSGNQVFTVGDPPVVVFTGPDPATSPDPVITWSFTAGGGRAQYSYQVIIKRKGITIYDSGVVVSATHSHDIPAPALPNNKLFDISIRASDGYLDTVAVADFETAYVGPVAPAYVVTSANFQNDGFIKITWNDTARAAGFTSWRVYRLRQGEEEFTLIHERTAIAASYEWDDWFAGGDSQYVVAQVTTSGGFEYESLFPNAPVTHAVNDDYWLLHPTDNTKHLRLRQVTSDSFTEDYEEADFVYAGKGRKKDYGTRLGYSGSLTCQLRDVAGGQTARQMKQAIEALKRERTVLYLRNPFGDVWQVSAGDLQFTRLPGIGTREFGDLVIPYMEVS